MVMNAEVGCKNVKNVPTVEINFSHLKLLSELLLTIL